MMEDDIGVFPDNLETSPGTTVAASKNDVSQANYTSDDISTVQDTDTETTDDILTQNDLPNVVHEKFGAAVRRRRSDEQRWLRAYQNYRGVYGPDMQFRETERSRVFVKVTKTKVLAAYGQVVDVLFGNNKFPLTVEPTKIPDGVSDSKYLLLNTNVSPEAKEALSQKALKNKNWRFKDTKEPVPQEILDGLEDQFSYAKDAIEEIVDDEGIEGNAPMSSEAVTWHPAMIAAKRMEKKMHDQLIEAQANKHLRSVAFDSALFGTGIMKGPFSVNKEYPRWTESETGDQVYDPLVKTVPDFEAVSIWDAYPDPEAYNQDEAEYFIQRHRLSKKQLRDLKNRPFFRDNQIEALIEDGPNYTRQWWETQIENDSVDTVEHNRWEVLEFWGYMDVEDLENVEGLKIPKKLKKEKHLQVNIWVSGNYVLRVILNPFKPSRIPYYAVPYELNPYSYFGIGVAENMEDSQLLMNGFIRMAVDNQALSGNMVFEVDASNLAPGQSLDVYPGKVFVRESGAPGQAIFGTKFPNVSRENMELFGQARMLADESTGLPSYMHGQTGVQQTGRTASGMSMLLGAASSAIKTVIKNYDDYLLAPLGRALFAFNMQFDPDSSIKGDLEVHARGIESLMANEVRSQRLMQFLQVLSQPATMPFGKIDYIVREIAKSLDLDPDKVTNSLADATHMAKVLQMMQPQEVATGPQSPGEVPAAANPADMTNRGDGNMAAQGAPLPAEPGFSANNGSGNGVGEG